MVGAGQGQDDVSTVVCIVTLWVLETVGPQGLTDRGEGVKGRNPSSLLAAGAGSAAG